MEKRAVSFLTAAVAAGLIAAGSASAATFSNTTLTVPLVQPPPGVVASTTGDSEPAISIGTNGEMVVGGLAWIGHRVNMWTGSAGSTPTFFGQLDKGVALEGSQLSVGGADETFDFGSTGTIHFGDLIVHPSKNNLQFGIAETNCPAGATAPSQCNERVLDTAGADRPWITSNGRNVWLAWHDSGNSSLIHVAYSADDGQTWTNAGSPIPGQGQATGDSTFNDSIGPIVADPTTGDVFEVYGAGQPGPQNAKTTNANKIYVSRSTTNADHWESTLVFSAPPFTRLNNFWPSMAVDPVTGALYVTWTDTHGVAVSVSTDHGSTWSAPTIVSDVTTTAMPWVAAYGGKVDVVYYGTSSTSANDPLAVWNTYDSQLQSGTWTRSTVSNAPNHVGVVCLLGDGCQNPLVTRTLLDLFQVAENPLTGKASIVYTDDTSDTWTRNGTTYQLPQIVLAHEQ